MGSFSKQWRTVNSMKVFILISLSVIAGLSIAAPAAVNGEVSSEESSEECVDGMENCQDSSSSSSSSSEEGDEIDVIKIEDIQQTISNAKPKYFYFQRTALNPFYKVYNVFY